ncbi:ribosome biogenesis GTPase YlqF [uncultured Ezakiella sp.]|uniref:ribosome biogenesis GTPase YlqF n=1 Tax=uncultured Ezakiella sp. TaxID=1637529 RepID=UPI0026007496|nr:ribosome biogenesis GTPase YlqF [uncultured Ezakiella sp.]
MSWYPGHMKKAIEEIESKLKLVDMVIEVVDARVPVATLNPIFDRLFANKERLLLLSKSDLADPKATEEFVNKFNEDRTSFEVNLSNRNDINRILKEISNIKNKMLEEKDGRVEDFNLKLIVVGMPNVGKSTLLNALKGKKSARVGNTPGLTKNQQWVKTDYGFMILDTPGILSTSRKNKTLVNNLKLVNGIENIEDDPAELAIILIDILKDLYPGVLKERYDVDEDADRVAILEDIGRARGTLLRGGEIDYSRAGQILLQDFRSGKLGRISLERVDDLDRTDEE